MANLAVFASGNGSNFEAIVKSLEGSPHRCALLVCDRKDAYALVRAGSLGVTASHVDWKDPDRAEKETRRLLDTHDVDFIALAGFMRILSPSFVDAWENRLVNVHPSLLPKYPGTRSIARAWQAGETEFGVTIHFVDAGTDTGFVIRQIPFRRESGDTLEKVEAKTHEIEHREYPAVIRAFLDEYGTED